MAKATHKGTCQCCGSMQMLPDGKLSKHGYTVQWGSFNGTCKGAGHLPYEQSCDLITEFVRAALEHADMLRGRVQELRRPAAQWKSCWFHEYINKKRIGGSGYEWRQVEIRLHPGHGYVEYLTHEGNWRRLPYYGRGRELRDVATDMNKLRADDLDMEIARIQQYVRWQNQRIAEWKLTDVAPR